jgi:alcohol dehydrogenase
MLRNALDLVEGRVFWLDKVTSNPAVSFTQEALNRYKPLGIELIVAFGGGSVIDVGKALSVALPGSADERLADLLDAPVSIDGRAKVPLIAVPTTFGTGSEVTPFSTLWDYESQTKRSLYGPCVFPTEAIIDPALAASLPRAQLIHTALDAINQAFESLWNRNSTPISEAYATRAVSLAFPLLRTLPQTLTSGDLEVLASASLLSGLAIAQTRTALCHSISYPLTLHYGVPHGLACAYTMAAVCRLVESSNRHRFADMASGLGYRSLYDAIVDLTVSLKVRDSVESYVGDLGQLDELAAEMFTPGRASNTIIDVDASTVRRVLAMSRAAQSAR